MNNELCHHVSGVDSFKSVVLPRFGCSDVIRLSCSAPSHPPSPARARLPAYPTPPRLMTHRKGPLVNLVLHRLPPSIPSPVWPSPSSMLLCVTNHTVPLGCMSSRSPMTHSFGMPSSLFTRVSPSPYHLCKLSSFGRKAITPTPS